MSNFDRILSSTPANVTAAKVTSKGYHWEPAKKLIQPWDAWQDLPLPVFPIAVDGENLIGLRRDRLVVIGYGGSSGNGGRWVVRCDCGMYGHQKAKFLKSDNSLTRAKCPNCDYLDELKKGHVPAAPLSTRGRR